jgi:uridine kinase
VDRPTLLAALSARILALELPHPARVAIDGVDTAGKTRLADELAAEVVGRGRAVLRATIDRFHNPRALRYRLGHDSPRGCYLDTFDLPALRQKLLDPLGPGGSRRVQTEHFDLHADRPVDSPSVLVALDTILLFDGVFLQRPELAGAWDLVLFVRVNFETVLARAVQRDAVLLGGPAAVEERYRKRYIPAQRFYLTRCRPEDRADFVIVNDDPDHPGLVVPTDHFEI